SGDLTLRGRKKSMIVLANGMKVHPEDVEAALQLDPRVQSSVVIGREEGTEVEVHAVLLTDHPDEGEAIIKAANEHLAPRQHIRSFTIWPEKQFPLTPTLKARRPVIIERVAQMEREEAERHESAHV